MNEGFDPEGKRLPIKLDGTSNGEFLPRPPPLVARLANRLALERAGATARRLGLSRRAFLKSLCGAAATLGAMNEAGAALGRVGGTFSLPGEAAFEPAVAAAALDGEELIFDVQGHHVNPLGSWRRWTNRWTYILRFFPQSDCGDGAVECFSAEHFIREVFLDSDTDLAVLSMVPAGPGDEPLLPEDAAATRALVQAMEGRDRLLIHALVRPNVDGDVAAMAEQMARYQVDGWKTYTQWGPQSVGYWLDDEATGIPFIEQARALGAPIICVHKGISLFGMTERYSTCRDVGVVAKRYPGVNFLIYHSGYQLDHEEGPYDPDRALGVDSLIRSLLDHGVAPNSNVYAELGTTWRRVMADSDQAPTCWGNSSSTWGKTMCSGARIPSGTAVHRIRSKPSAASRSPTSSRNATATHRLRRSVGQGLRAQCRACLPTLCRKHSPAHRRRSSGEHQGGLSARPIPAFSPTDRARAASSSPCTAHNGVCPSASGVT